MICRMLSTMRSIILIALTIMLTVTNTEAHPSPAENFRCSPTDNCDWF